MQQEKLLLLFQDIRDFLVDQIASRFLRLVKSGTFVLYITVSFCVLGFAKLVVSVGMYGLENSTFTSLSEPQKAFYTSKQKKDLAISNPGDIVLDGSPLYIPYTFSQEDTLVNGIDSLGFLPPSPKVSFELLATLEGAPSFARALIFIRKKEEVYGLEKGNLEFSLYSKIGTAKITRIGQGFIKYREDGNLYTMYVGDESTSLSKGAEAEKITNFKKKTLPGSSNSQKITKVISREEVLRILRGNQANLFKGASFGPSVSNGVISGYKLHRVSSSHIFHKWGARSGDILTSINEFKLDDAGSMLEVWKNIDTAKEISLKLIRKGKPLEVTLFIQD